MEEESGDGEGGGRGNTEETGVEQEALYLLS